MTGPFDQPRTDRTDKVPVAHRILRASRNLGARRTLLGAVAVLAIGSGAAFTVLPGPHAALSAGPRPSDQSTPTADAPSAAPTADAPSVAPTADAPSAAAGAATVAPSRSDGSGPSTSGCQTDELQVTATDSSTAGVDDVYRFLVFTNISTRTCTLFGFPGVEYLTGPDGQQVNEAATRNNGTPVLTTLDPWHAGYALVRTGHPEQFPDNCEPVEVAGYGVYLPDENAAVFVSAPTQQCSTDGVNATKVGPILPAPSHDGDDPVEL